MSEHDIFKYDVFVCYANADENWLLSELIPKLDSSGISRYDGPILGLPKIDNIDIAVRESRCVVVVLSPAFVEDHHLGFALKRAMASAMSLNEWRVLPVLLHYCRVPDYIDMIDGVDLTSGMNTEAKIHRLVEQINLRKKSHEYREFAENSIVEPVPYTYISSLESLREPRGNEPLDSHLYVYRKEDKMLWEQIYTHKGTTTTICAPRQTGKSSMLIRGLNKADLFGSRIISLDLQSVDSGKFTNLDVFLRHLITVIFDILGIELGHVDDYWNEDLGATYSFKKLMERFVLLDSQNKVVLAIDEIDRIREMEFRDSFFGMLRSFHNIRAWSSSSEKYWYKFDMILVTAYDPGYLVTNPNQSPFNVGKILYPPDFDKQQVLFLNDKHNSPLIGRDLPNFLDMLGGHPYLTRQAMYTMAKEKLKWKSVVASIGSYNNPFSDHLESIRRKLNTPQLQYSMKEVISIGRCTDEESRNILFRQGLIKVNASQCACRCGLYRDYLYNRI